MRKSKGPMEEIFELEEKVVEHMPITAKKKEKFLLVLDLIVNVAIIIVLVVVVRKFLISPFQVFGPSMCKTLNYFHETCQRGFGEYLIVNKAVYQNFFGLLKGDPKRGDIIVFKPQPDAKEFYIKRVIGVPGDIVEVKNGKVFLNGEKLPEPYLSEDNQEQTESFLGKTSFTVQEGKYFVMGDNRRESTDSRMCFSPPFSPGCKGDKYYLPRDQIEGKAWIVLWPFNKIRLLHNPNYALAVK